MSAIVKIIRSSLLIGLLLALSAVNVAAELPAQLQATIKSMGLSPFPDQPASVDFTLKTLDGKTVKLSDFKGKVVLLNFWATWCPPCRAEMPSMQKLYETTKNSDFVMLAVDAQEETPTVAAFIKKNNYSFPVLLDSSGQVNEIYGIRAIPTSYIIDRNGKVVAGIGGAHDWSAAAVLKGIQAILGTK